DILIRYHRMNGEESLWMPGTDHAGIATQNVVEREIAKEGLSRKDLGRDKFIERVWQWREEYGSTIIRQLKKLGASCDWQRTRFTMDQEYSDAVLEVFVKLYEEGLIYQGNYIINWCPRCQTALSDEEAPHRELKGNLYYLKYPFKDDPDNFVVVATTRPETMLGDTAVAVNPKDKRYKKFIGKTLLLPLVSREIKVIADNMVDVKFGTGAVKVTPAHDPNDYLLGRKHKLEFVNVMYPDARMNENAGDYSGLDRFEAREVILKDLKERNLLDKTEDHQLSVGHCYRCHTIIEPYLSKQWFVKMKPLSKPALDVVRKGKIKFYPERWRKVYLNWMENIQDWCISRQIWWGHRLPVYYCRSCQLSHACRQAGAVSCQQKAESRKLKAESSKGIIVSKIRPDKCPECGSVDIYQDEDVLDTWFSSWLWPFATFYWPFLTQIPANQTQINADKSSADICVQSAKIRVQKADLYYFYPTSVLVTAPEIIFFWVARMIMAGLHFMKDIPFKDVYIHGTVRDIEGKKMSKSLGNAIDPLEIIDEYGTDALRFSLISITSQGQDVFLSKERFEQGRNFANKIWNASRFIMMNLDQDNINKDLCKFFKQEDLDLVNRWILSRFYSLLRQVDKNLKQYRFNEAANMLYSFFWHEFCDWYLELTKLNIKLTQNQVVMYKVLEKFLRVLHPFMPYISEDIWSKINPQAGSIMNQSLPHIQEELINKKLELEAQSIFDIITQARNLRKAIDLKSDAKVKVSIYSHSKSKAELIRKNSNLIISLARLEGLELQSSSKRPQGTISATGEEIDIYLHFAGLLDIERERRKLGDKILEIKKALESKEKMLENKNFIKKAPREVVEKEKENKEKLSDQLKRLKLMSDELN
ncbi:MAG: valine--tRNA ligase, partial [Candidatus Omnitrophica bacterium]|nr:valine--tRNA ligase [Candidatus Omnitrophota bacterium]